MLLTGLMVILIHIGLSTQLDWQEGSAYCRVRCIFPYVNCADSADNCFDGQIFVINGSYCGCCDACYTVAGEGDFCGTHQEYYQYVKCKTGLTCDTLFQICLNYTSIIQYIHLKKPQTNSTTSNSTLTTLPETTSLLPTVNSTESSGNLTNVNSTIPSTNKKPKSRNSYENVWESAFESFGHIFDSVKNFIKSVG
ncbi:hypothetical protein C0J52_18728 [Blattella germanica]|nr:hypothetical protein C0J52_18728 [Blattella germanica]